VSVVDFNFVTNRLATGGGISSPADVEALAQAGVTHCIDCRAEFDDAALLAGHPSIAYLWDGTADDGQPKPQAWFQKGIEFALAALASPRHKVYAHCAAGVNRGPSMALAILLALGLKAPDAESMIRTARPQVGLAYKADAIQAVAALGYV
jgi:dual specificity phosphatase 3